MYQIGNKVIYGMHGVCVVVELENKVIDRKQVTYLVLEPVGQAGTRYLIPTHNAAAMSKVRPMLTGEVLEELLSSDAVRSDAWIREENQRKQYYRELITSNDVQRLLQMVCSLYRYRSVQAAAGRKFHMCDENFLRDAERQLAGEISAILGFSQTEALRYLRERLKETPPHS